MGYNVNMRGSHFIIPADKLDAACQALKGLNKRDELKSGGSYSGGKQVSRNFSWMPEHYDETMHTAAEILEALGFEVSWADGADLELMGYDSKSGDEGHFLAALAPFVPAGSYVNWEGEDGEYWQDYFDGEGGHEQKSGVIVYQ